MSHIIYLTIIVILIAVIVFFGYTILQDIEDLAESKRVLRSAEDDLRNLHEKIDRIQAAETETVNVHLVDAVPQGVYKGMTLNRERTSELGGYATQKLYGYTLNPTTAEEWARKGINVHYVPCFLHDGEVYRRENIQATRIKKLEP